MSVASPQPNRPRVVIVGAGFGGIEVACGLGRAPVDITLIDRHNCHVFQPLLYQVATAALSAADIADPVRRLVRKYRNIEVLLGTVTGISLQNRHVTVEDVGGVAFDILVIAAGAAQSYLGHEDWRSLAPPLKSLSDAQRVRSRLLTCFERAESARDPREQKRLLTVVIVGGGPTGVELAGSVGELARYTLAKDFRHIDAASTNIVLIEAGPRILPEFAAALSDYARRKLRGLGVEVRENCLVQNIAPDRVDAGGEIIAAGLVVWAAGVKAAPIARQLGVPAGHGGRIKVDRTLAVPGLKSVYALGDIADFVDGSGHRLPGLAQVAKQQGHHLGKVLAENVRTGASIPAFRYRSFGDVAIIGRHAAIAQIGRLRLTGTVAWLIWAVVHIYFLSGLQHRFLVAFQWLWRYLTYDRGARLIWQEQPPGRAG